MSSNFTRRAFSAFAFISAAVLSLNAATVFTDEATGLSFTVDDASSVSLTGPASYEGRVLTIPSEVEYGGTVYSVTSVGSSAFKDNASIESVVIPESVRVLNGSAFRGCGSLREVKITEGVESVLAHCFRESGLESVTFPASVRTLGTSAFMNCVSLTSVSMDACSVTALYGAFQGCSALRTVSLPALTEFSYPDFYDCAALESVSLLSETVPARALPSDTFSGVFDAAWCGEHTVLYVPDASIESYVGSWLDGFSEIRPLSEAPSAPEPIVPDPADNPDHLLLGELPAGMTTLRLTLSDGTVLTLPWLKGESMPLSISLPAGLYLMAFESDGERVQPRVDEGGSFLLRLPAVDGPVEYVADVRSDTTTEVSVEVSDGEMPEIVRMADRIVLRGVAAADKVFLYDMSGRQLTAVAVRAGYAELPLPSLTSPCVLRVGSRAFKFMP